MRWERRAVGEERGAGAFRRGAKKRGEMAGKNGGVPGGVRRGKEGKRNRFLGRAACFFGRGGAEIDGAMGEEKEKKTGAGENGKRARPFSFLGADSAGWAV